MAFVRDRDGVALRDSQGNARVCVTEAQAKAHDAYAARKKAQQEALQERIQMRSMRAPEEQMKHLDLRLGNGVGAVRERARLRKKM